jgi:hypothetical protein
LTSEGVNRESIQSNESNQGLAVNRIRSRRLNPIRILVLRSIRGSNLSWLRLSKAKPPRVLRGFISQVTAEEIRGVLRTLKSVHVMQRVRFDIEFAYHCR